MSILRSIFDKLRGRGSSQQETSAQSSTTASSQPSGQAGQQAMLQNVDVDRVLAEMASKKGGGGNYRESIVDLLKLLDLDSSLASRKELATELGCPAEKMGDSAQMNMWLHKAVLARIAANGGNVPKELLD